MKSLFQSYFPVSKQVLNIFSLGGWSCCLCKHMFAVFSFLGLVLVLFSATCLLLSQKGFIFRGLCLHCLLFFLCIFLLISQAQGTDRISRQKTDFRIRRNMCVEKKSPKDCGEGSRVQVLVQNSEHFPWTSCSGRQMSLSIEYTM